MLEHDIEKHTTSRPGESERTARGGFNDNVRTRRGRRKTVPCQTTISMSGSRGACATTNGPDAPVLVIIDISDNLEVILWDLDTAVGGIGVIEYWSGENGHPIAGQTDRIQKMVFQGIPWAATELEILRCCVGKPDRA